MISPEASFAHERSAVSEQGQGDFAPLLNLLDLKSSDTVAKTLGTPADTPEERASFEHDKGGQVAAGKTLETRAGQESERVEKGAKAEQDGVQELTSEEKLYPELVFSRMAVEALEDKNGDPRQNFERANSLFHVAEIQLEKFIEYQGGVAAIFQTVAKYNDELFKILGQFLKGERGLKVAESSERASQEKLLRELLKDYSKQDLLATLRAEKGETLKNAILGVYDNDEREVIGEIDLNLNKIQLFSSLKVRHALAANAFAVSAKDGSARILSENILKSIASVDPETFRTSPEIKGLLLQSERGEAMDLADGKALALAFNEEARKTIIRTMTGAEALINGELRAAGAAEAIKLLAASIAANAGQAKRAWEEWSESKKFPVLYEKAQDLVTAQKK